MSTGESLSEEGGVLTAFSGGIGRGDTGASCDDCCPSGGRDFAVCAGNSEMSTWCYAAVPDRPNARRERHDN